MVHTEDFDQHFKIVCVGPGFWQVFNRHTAEPASPRYNDRQAAKNYVMRELNIEMEEQIDELLREPGVG